MDKSVAGDRACVFERTLGGFSVAGSAGPSQPGSQGRQRTRKEGAGVESGPERGGSEAPPGTTLSAGRTRSPPGTPDTPEPRPSSAPSTGQGGSRVVTTGRPPFLAHDKMFPPDRDVATRPGTGGRGGSTPRAAHTPRSPTAALAVKELEAQAVPATPRRDGDGGWGRGGTWQHLLGNGRCPKRVLSVSRCPRISRGTPPPVSAKGQGPPTTGQVPGRRVRRWPPQGNGTGSHGLGAHPAPRSGEPVRAGKSAPHPLRAPHGRGHGTEGAEAGGSPLTGTLHLPR